MRKQLSQLLTRVHKGFSRYPFWVAIVLGVAVAGVAYPLATVAAAKTRPSVNFVADYETGDFSQWDHLLVSSNHPDDALIVTAPVYQGKYAARFTVNPGDSPTPSGERTEASMSQTNLVDKEGVQTWYGWATYFPDNYNPVVAPGEANFFTQWHGIHGSFCTSTSPPTVFLYTAGQDGWELHMRVNNKEGIDSTGTCRENYYDWKFAKLTPNHWYTFALSVKWSSDPNVGYVQLWIDGKLVADTTHLATLMPGGQAYLKQGSYRAVQPEGIDRTTTLYFDDLKRGTSQTAVTPKPNRNLISAPAPAMPLVTPTITNNMR